MPDARVATGRGSVTKTTRPVTTAELDLLVEACRAIPPAGLDLSLVDPRTQDFVTSVLVTVLDLQMRTEVVEGSIEHYWTVRWEEVRTIDDLRRVLDRHPDDREGNLAVARYLWGNNHWTRASWLRGFVRYLHDEGLATYEELRSWAARSEFERDFQGRAKYLGMAAFQGLRMRLGVDTVKPDVHLRNFVGPIVGHRFSDVELIRVVEEAARRLGLSARALDLAIWEHQRRGS
jgi:hypothetical protein